MGKVYSAKTDKLSQIGKFKAELEQVTFRSRSFTFTEESGASAAATETLWKQNSVSLAGDQHSNVLRWAS